jgi:hypothetical protein
MRSNSSTTESRSAEAMVASNERAIADLRMNRMTPLLRRSNQLRTNERTIADLRDKRDDSINEKIKPTENKLNEMDGQAQGLQKTVAIFESRNLESVEKFKEVPIITNNIQTQVNDQEKKMVEQSANNLESKIEQNLLQLNSDLDKQIVDSKHRLRHSVTFRAS